MLSKSQISFINALHQKKHRKENRLFIAEGIKSITEFLHSDYSVDTIYCTAEALPKLDKPFQKVKVLEITDKEIIRISALTNPQNALALIKIPESEQLISDNLEGFTFVLDGIQDPGNLGTIIRTCDWFGFSTIICSDDTVDAYNPKVVQATMGSLARVKVHYTDLYKFLSSVNKPIFGALLSGTSLYNCSFKEEGFIVLGNEGNGISKEIESLITNAVTIPKYGSAESLNVAVSAAIFCSELKRKK